MLLHQFNVTVLFLYPGGGANPEKEKKFIWRDNFTGVYSTLTNTHTHRHMHAEHTHTQRILYAHHFTQCMSSSIRRFHLEVKTKAFNIIEKKNLSIFARLYKIILSGLTAGPTAGPTAGLFIQKNVKQRRLCNWLYSILNTNVWFANTLRCFQVTCVEM